MRCRIILLKFRFRPPRLGLDRIIGANWNRSCQFEGLFGSRITALRILVRAFLKAVLAAIGMCLSSGLLTFGWAKMSTNGSLVNRISSPSSLYRLTSLSSECVVCEEWLPVCKTLVGDWSDPGHGFRRGPWECNVPLERCSLNSFKQTGQTPTSFGDLWLIKIGRASC